MSYRINTILFDLYFLLTLGYVAIAVILLRLFFLVAKDSGQSRQSLSGIDGSSHEKFLGKSLRAYRIFYETVQKAFGGPSIKAFLFALVHLILFSFSLFLVASEPSDWTPEGALTNSGGPDFSYHNFSIFEYMLLAVLYLISKHPIMLAAIGSFGAVLYGSVLWLSLKILLK